VPIRAGALLIWSVHLNRNKRKQTELTEPSFSSSLLTMLPVFLTAKHANHGPAPPHDLFCSSPSPPGLQLLHHGEEGRIHWLPPLPTTSSIPPHLLLAPAAAPLRGGAASAPPHLLWIQLLHHEEEGRQGHAHWEAHVRS
jgi:hypothetical protein